MKVAIVTGASAGIGEATARRLAAEGYAVLVTARRVERLECLVAEIRAAGGEAKALAGDIRDAVFCRRLVEESAAWGELEILVANAGMGYSGPFAEMGDDEMLQLIEINVLGVLRTIHAAIPIMRVRRRGTIVIVGSVLSRIATPGAAVYCATKHAVAGFADALRLELRDDLIRVVTILPGYTATEFFDVMIRRGERAVDKIKKYSFFHSADDVARVIVRRIARPVDEVVVGLMNTMIVFAGTRFPGPFRRLIGLVDRVMKRGGASAF